MFESGSESQDVVPSSREVTSSQEKTSERDELDDQARSLCRKAKEGGTYHITTPASCPSGGKVRQTSSKRRNGLGRVDTGTLDQTILLDSSEREIVRERVTRRDEFGTLFDHGPSSCLVGCVDDQGKVLGSHERWAGGFDDIESGLEPLCRFAQSW